MPKATIIQHVPFERPARVQELLEQRGWEIAVLHPYSGDRVPHALHTEDLLIVMGGPMGVGDVRSDAYPFLPAELKLIESRVATDSPTLGICLGAQLMAFAAGAQVYPNRHPPGAGPLGSLAREVGWADVSFALSSEDPALQRMPSTSPMFHWHGDTFDLPSQSTLLASTPICKHQAFRLRRRLFGLQFHCEMERPDIERLLAADVAYAQEVLGPDAAARVRRDTDTHLARARETGTLLLENIFDAMVGSARPT